METSQEKLDWAESHRKKGNELFVKGKYKEAMDVYLTCLVAIEKPKSNNRSKDCSVSDMTDEEWEDTVEKLVKLPVLLNLSACSLKLGMFKKTCQFCDFGIELESGKSSAKLYFRRGKAKISLTEYDEARIDLNKCLTLLQEEEENMDKEMDSNMMVTIRNMKRSVDKELKRLDDMILVSKRNHEKQAKAMKKVLGGERSNNKSNDQESRSVEESEKIVDETPLYSESNGLREFSRLRAPPRNYFSSSLEKKEENVSRSSAFVCCIRAVEHVLRKMLYLLGDEEAMTKNFDDDDDGDDEYNSDYDDDEQKHRKVD